MFSTNLLLSRTRLWFQPTLLHAPPSINSPPVWLTLTFVDCISLNVSPASVTFVVQAFVSEPFPRSCTYGSSCSPVEPPEAVAAHQRATGCQSAGKFAQLEHRVAGTPSVFLSQKTAGPICEFSMVVSCAPDSWKLSMCTPSINT